VGITAGITGHYRPSLWIGWVLTVLGAGLLLLLGPDTTVTQWIFLNLPIGIGTGMLFPSMGLSIQAACDPKLNGQAAAFFSFMRTFGQSIGVAVSGVIFQNAFKEKLLGIPEFAPMADQFSRDATTVVEIIKQMNAGPERDVLVQAFSDSLRMIYIALLAFAALSLVLSLFIKSYSLNQEHHTEQGLVRADQSEIQPEKNIEAA
jgi:MFS family permease